MANLNMLEKMNPKLCCDVLDWCIFVSFDLDMVHVEMCNFVRHKSMKSSMPNMKCHLACHVLDLFRIFVTFDLDPVTLTLICHMQKCAALYFKYKHAKHSF